MLKNVLTYEIMTPASVGVPATSFVLGKHSGRNALNQHCKDLGFHLDRRELDHVYRQFLALADESKKVEDSCILEIIRAMRCGESYNEFGTPSQHRVPAKDPLNGFDVTGTGGRFPHENEQQEDYLWGV
jgi:isopropylmalate/homocitrate/citramalate synthase